MMQVVPGQALVEPWSPGYVFRVGKQRMQNRGTGTRKAILDSAQRIIVHKGYAAVGLNEVLNEAGVPKGSFYHWFASRDAFGKALLESYFEDYFATMDRVCARPGAASGRLLEYWQSFYDMQTMDDCQGRCLVVKLGAEVSDLSESMRRALMVGTDGIVQRIHRMIGDGLADASIAIDGDPAELSQDLYSGWVGASVLAKIHRSPEALDRAMTMTRQHLHLDAAEGGPRSPA